MFRKIRPKNLILACVLLFTLGFYVTVFIERMKCANYFQNLRQKLNIEIKDDIMCYHEEKSDTNTTIPDERDVIFENNAIFFISAACEPTLPIHAACAIESATHAMLDRVIYVLVTKPVKHFACHDCILQGLTSKNVIFVHIQIDEFVRGTPLEGIFDGEFLYIGVKRQRRVLEVLKIAALYKYGGVVVDLDMIFAKSVQHLGANWIGTVNSSRFGSGIMSFNRKTAIAKSMLEKTMEILKEYKHEVNLDSGFALTEAFRDLCYESPVEGCSHFKIYEPQYFYNLNSTSNYLYFEEGSLTSKIFGYYIWDKSQIRRKEGTLYMKIMEEYCPNVFSFW